MNDTETSTEITVGELRAMYIAGEHDIEIETPDGWCGILEWFDKGVLPCVKVTTEAGRETVCATNHLLQAKADTGEIIWLFAEEVAVGSTVVVRNDDGSIGFDIVTAVVEVDEVPCYDFTVDHTNHRYWGDGFSSHNSGKSLIVSGNMVKWCQENNIQTVMLDSEGALDRSWMKALGVNPDLENSILRLPVSSPDDCALVIGDFMTDYVAENKDLPEEERQKVLFVIDSLGMLSSKSEQNQFDAGEMKGDKGIKAKALKSLVTQCLRLFNGWPVGLVATNHTYKSQDMYNPADVISGGVGFMYASSIIVTLTKLKMKEDEDGNKTTSVQGIRTKALVSKTRYAKPFEEVEIKIPYEQGMNPFSGIVDMFEKAGLIKKAGNKLEYTDPETGEVIKQYRKEWERDTDLLLKIMHGYKEEGKLGVDHGPEFDEEYA
jgi:RecA/RadA recombinase